MRATHLELWALATPEERQERTKNARAASRARAEQVRELLLARELADTGTSDGDA